MTAIVQALSRFTAAAATDTKTETLKLLAVFCGAGLVVSLYMILGYGLDLTPGIF
jgi:hypothetical protein